MWPELDLTTESACLNTILSGGSVFKDSNTHKKNFTCFQILLRWKMKGIYYLFTSSCHCYVALFLNNLSTSNDAKSRRRCSSHSCSDLLFSIEEAGVQKSYRSHSMLWTQRVQDSAALSVSTWSVHYYFMMI